VLSCWDRWIAGCGRAPVWTIETLCTFECPEGGFDLVQMGKAYITAHHHIHTEDGWMTARQAADRGQGTLLTNQVYLRVYSLCLEGGGNIIIDTTATLQNAPTQIEAATMGCRFEPSTDPQYKGSLTYPDSIRAGMDQIKGMETGRKHFGSNEVETDPNGELRFRNIPDIKRVDSPTLDLNPRKEMLGATLGAPMHDTITQQEATSRESQVTQALDTTIQASHLASKTTAQLESDTEIEKDKRENQGELNTRPIVLPDTSNSDPRTGQRPSEEYLCDLDAVKEGLPEPEPTEHTSMINKYNEMKPSNPYQDSTQGHQTDIYL